MRIAFRISLVAAILLQLAGTAWADEVTEWNKIMLEELRVAGIAGVVATRQAATVQAAVYDAVNGIERRFTPIHVEPDAVPGSSVRAAAIQAAYATLIQIVPASQKPGLDAKREASLSALNDDKGPPSAAPLSQ